uniref:Uncharacterized protein n=1 Tax=Arundo donax TaxID=35708 RepID=A0A0A9D2U0_ARUDO
MCPSSPQLLFLHFSMVLGAEKKNSDQMSCTVMSAHKVATEIFAYANLKLLRLCSTDRGQWLLILS